MNKEFTLAYYSAAAMEIPSLSLGVTQFTKDGGHIKVHAKTQTQLFDEKQIAATHLRQDILKAFYVDN